MSLAEIHEMLDRIARETWHASEKLGSNRKILEQISLYAETARCLASTLTEATPVDDVRFTMPAPAELN